jgi:hypothetical protein
MANPWDRLHLRMFDVASRRLGAVEVIHGGLTTKGVFDRQSELVIDGQAISVENALTVKTSELGGLNYGSEVRVGGINYIARQEPMRLGDGLLCVVSLMEVAGSAVTPTGGIRPMALGDLSDVDLTAPAAGEVLKYDGSQWVDGQDEGSSFVFTQSSPASTWTINHNLGFKPSVELFDSGSQEIDGHVVHTSTNQVVVSLTKAIAGFARLN